MTPDQGAPDRGAPRKGEALGLPAGADLAGIAGAFGHLLHEAGVPVTPERSSRFAQVVVLAAPTTLPELAALGRTTLVSGRDQLEVFDRVFAQVFGGVVDQADFRGDSAHPPPPSARPEGERAAGEPEREGDDDVQPSGSSGLPGESGTEPESDEESVLAAVSVEERLGEKNFADCSEEELALLNALIAALPFVAPLLTARRKRRHSSGRVLDVRATLRGMHRTAGDPVHRVHRRPTTRPRRVVLIADVSGSMEPYARVYLHLMRGAVKALGAEAFVFATRLTRLTRPLQHTHPDVAYRRAAAAAPDWSGGTRIGSALKTFLDQHGRRGLARGAVVVIVSDGWEIEDPALVGRAMEQLSRLAFHVIWVNPRKAARGYQPVVGGMAAAMPYVDTFVSGHSMRAIEDVLEAIRDAAHDGRHHRHAALPHPGVPRPEDELYAG
ncbi:MAG: VWA domain-containing protein [Frankiales bacterium]|nr:VWA domain-containing protein [Frankiales bacterium]